MSPSCNSGCNSPYAWVVMACVSTYDETKRSEREARSAVLTDSEENSQRLQGT